MYLDYFGLDKDPFTISPDPSFLYPSPLHRQALAHLKYGLEREGGFILLTGEVGTGKTTLTRLLLQQLPGNIRVAYILNARLGEQDLMSSICQELNIVTESDKTSVRQCTDLLNKDLLQAHSEGKKTLVVIEEAQNLEPNVLEMLRLLTNLETNTTKLLHILLVAQPEILETIGRPELRQLNQRIISRYHIQPLGLIDTSHYLRHRMRKAGCTRPVFDSASTKELHRVSGGIPRIINLLAERSLIGAYASNESGVTKNIVKNAAPEVLGGDERKTKRGIEGIPAISKMIVPGVVLLLMVIVGWTAFSYFFPERFYAAKSSGELIRTEAGPLDAGEEDAGISNGAQEDSISQLPQPLAEAAEGGYLDTEIPTLENPYSQLLELWSIDQEADRLDDLCQLAETEGLLCKTIMDASIEQLATISRPGLVRLWEENDRVAIYLLTSLERGLVGLSNAEGEVFIGTEELQEQWDGYFLYLWKAPPGYENALSPGAKNPQVIDWLQRQLTIWEPEYEYLISGGLFSPAISEEVRRFQAEQELESDGVLGPATITRLNDLTDDMPNLSPAN